MCIQIYCVYCMMPIVRFSQNFIWGGGGGGIWGNNSDMILYCIVPRKIWTCVTSKCVNKTCSIAVKSIHL